MVESRLRDGTEPAVFVPEVAKQHDVFAGAIAFGVLALVFDWINGFGNARVLPRRFAKPGTCSPYWVIRDVRMCEK